jgi:hypothetical protein
MNVLRIEELELMMISLLNTTGFKYVISIDENCLSTMSQSDSKRFKNPSIGGIKPLISPWTLIHETWYPYTGPTVAEPY